MTSIPPVLNNEFQGEPGDATLALIARAASLSIIGKKDVAIQKALELPKKTLRRYRREWGSYWEAACDSARNHILKSVRAQVGTSGILDDPDEYIRLAKAAEKIACTKNEKLFPTHRKTTLCSFYEDYYLKTCHFEARDCTIYQYRIALRLWQKITGDPPLESITAETLTFFRDVLAKCRGVTTVTRAKPVTVASRLRIVQTLLDKAGPAGRGNRDARGIISTVPWIRRPRFFPVEHPLVTPEMFRAVYQATAGMDVPVISGIKSPEWWRALLVVTFNTQLRRRTLFEMEMTDIDWKNARLVLPPGRLKAGRAMVIHLTGVALEHLRIIRTEREKVFPWGMDMTTFHKYFHRLQNLAGIPKAEHFGLHRIRSTVATILWEDSPQAAQYSLGHTSARTTANHYVTGSGIVARALDALSQPWTTADVAKGGA